MTVATQRQMETLVMRGLSAALLVLVGCGSNPAPTGGVNNIGGHPLVSNDISYTEGICPNNLACLVLTISDATGACNLQVSTHSSNAFYKNSSFATFELYAPSGVPSPIPVGTYPISANLGVTQASVVTFFNLDSACAGAFQAVATTGQVTLSGSSTITVNYNADFGIGTLTGAVTAVPCVVNPDTGTAYCI
jgi:hypothetical protein